MFMERLFNEGNAPLLERWAQFASQRHRLIAENVVNISTPNYRQKDMSPEAFQEMLARRVDQRHEAGPGQVGFDDIKADVEEAEHGVLFHDGQSRSMEQLMSDQAKNALMHNLAIELLRKQFQTMEMALKDKPL
jgi:flagellar basal-body rod protein FlgB